MSVARLDAFEARMEVGAEKIPGRLIEPVEQVRAKQRLVDHDPLGGRERSPRRLVGNEPDLDSGTPLRRVGRLMPGTDEDRDPLEDERLSHHNASSQAKATTPHARVGIESTEGRPRRTERKGSAFPLEPLLLEPRRFTKLRRDYRGGSAQATQRTDRTSGSGRRVEPPH